MFRPWVHPAGFVLVCLLKDGVGDYQAMFHTKVQEHSTIGVFLAEPVSAEKLVPELVVLPHPGAEVPEYQDFLSHTDTHTHTHTLVLKSPSTRTFFHTHARTHTHTHTHM